MQRTWISQSLKTIRLPQPLKRILTPQLLKSAYPIFTLLIIGTASFTAENLFTQAIAPVKSCQLTAAGAADANTNLAVSQDLSQDTLAQNFQSGYALFCSTNIGISSHDTGGGGSNPIATVTAAAPVNINVDTSAGPGDTTGKDIGNNPPNLCESKTNSNSTPSGPQGHPLNGTEYNHESDGSDVYCMMNADSDTAPTMNAPTNPYYSSGDTTQFTITPVTKDNLDLYCQKSQNVGGGPSGGGAQRDGDSTDGWNCHKAWNDGKGLGLNVNNVCTQQLGTNSSASHARIAYYWTGNPETFECLNGVSQLGSDLAKSDIDSYCKAVSSKYQGSAMQGTTAYDYFCQANGDTSNVINQNGNSVKFDTMLDVCEWMHKDHKYVIDALDSYPSATWGCWGPNT